MLSCRILWEETFATVPDLLRSLFGTTAPHVWLATFQNSQIRLFKKRLTPNYNLFTCCWAPVKKKCTPSVQRGSFDLFRWFFCGCRALENPYPCCRCEIVILHGSFHQVWRLNGSLTAHAPAAQISITGRSWYRWKPWPLMASEWRFSELC